MKRPGGNTRHIFINKNTNTQPCNQKSIKKNSEHIKIALMA